MVKTPGNADDVSFETEFLILLIVVRQKYMTSLEFLSELHSIDLFNLRKSTFGNFA